LPSQAVIELAKAFPRVAYASRDISCDDVKELLQVIATELNCELPTIPEAFANKTSRNLYSALAEANRQKGVDSRKLIRAYERIGKAVRELSASLNFQKIDDPEARAIAHDVRIAIGEFAEWANPSRQSTKTDGFEEFLQKLSEISNMSDEAVEQIKQHRMVCFAARRCTPSKRQMKGIAFGSVRRWQLGVVEVAMDICAFLGLRPTLSRDEVTHDETESQSIDMQSSRLHKYSGNLIVVVRLIERQFLADLGLGFGADATAHDTFAKLFASRFRSCKK
jgi:hypothetical protein